MTEEGILQKISTGEFTISSRTFVPTWTDEMQEINRKLEERFPFLKFCIWSIADLRRFSHHISNHDIIFVDVEKDGVEAVFNHLFSQEDKNRRTLMAPSRQEYDRYVGKEPIIIIRPLVSRAPLIDNRKVTLEKIIVDAAVDHDFFTYQGYELVRIGKNIFDLKNVNKKKMLAYASRRHHKSTIEQLLQDIKDFEYD